MKKSFLLPALAVPFLLASCGLPGGSGGPDGDRPNAPRGGSGATMKQRQAPSLTDGSSDSGPRASRYRRQADTGTSAS